MESKDLRTICDNQARNCLHRLHELLAEDRRFIRSLMRRRASLLDEELLYVIQQMEHHRSQATCIRHEWRTWIPARRRAGSPAAGASGTVGDSDLRLASSGQTPA